MIGAEEKKYPHYFDPLILESTIEPPLNHPRGKDLMLLQFDEILSGKPSGVVLTVERGGFVRLGNRNGKGNP